MIERVAQALETVVMDLLLSPSAENEQLRTLRQCASEAYRLYRVLPSSALQQNKYTLNDSDVELIPSKDNGKLVHFVNALEDARLEFIERGDADMAQERARHF